MVITCLSALHRGFTTEAKRRWHGSRVSSLADEAQAFESQTLALMCFKAFGFNERLN